MKKLILFLFHWVRTINMAGAAITITILTLAAVHTLGLEVSFVSALFISIVAALCACGHLA